MLPAICFVTLHPIYSVFHTEVVLLDHIYTVFSTEVVDNSENLFDSNISLPKVLNGMIVTSTTG